MGSLIALLIGIVLFLYLLVLYTLYPYVVMFKHIRGSSNEHQPSHLWLAGMFFIPPTAFIYCLKYLDGRFFRFNSWFGIIGTTLIAGAIIIALLNYNKLVLPYLVADVNKSKTDVYKSKNLDKLTREEYVRVYALLDDLKSDMISGPNGVGFAAIDVSMELNNLLGVYIKDETLTRAELQKWQNLVTARRVLDKDKLRAYINDTKDGREPASLPTR